LGFHFCFGLFFVVALLLLLLLLLRLCACYWLLFIFVFVVPLRLLLLLLLLGAVQSSCVSSFAFLVIGPTLIFLIVGKLLVCCAHLCTKEEGEEASVFLTITQGLESIQRGTVLE
jgi:hypothetical protein